MKKIAHFLPAHPTLQNGMMKMYEREMPEFNFDYFVIRLNNQIMQELPENIHVSIIDCGAPFTRLKDIKKIVSVMKDYDYIVFHSMMLTLPTKLYIRFFNQYLIDKIVWIEWGYDIYTDRGCDLKSRLKFLLKRLVIKLFEKRIPIFVAIHPADIKEYMTGIKGKGKIFVAPYREHNGININLDDYKYVSLAERIRNGEEIYIQVNHRAEAILKHKEVLDCLLKFKNENIKILLPLCYGDKDYGDYIEQYARDKFGNKAIIQREVMAYDDYIDLLKRVDIFILNSTRQIALGNIHPMILMRKKIFLPAGSVLYRYYSDEGDEISCLEMIKNANFTYDDLCKDLNTEIAQNHLIDYLQEDTISKWRDIFNLLVENDGRTQMDD